MISPLKPILTFFGVKDGKIEATALKRIADSLNNLINTYVAWADTVGQDYSISNFIKWLKNSQGEIVATEFRMYALKAATLALNMVFAMFASWAISAGMNAFINWMKNAKTHSEQLISTMEDAHDAAEEAQQDVDDIQQKLDDLDQKIKDLGAEKIEDIVDPQEKAKIQEINNLLETQLRLKKQIADDENNKTNKAASDVFNDKSEVVVSNETPTSYAEADPNGIGVTVTPSKNVTRTEALREHITYEDSKLNLLENGTVKTTVIIEGGGGGGGSTSTITIERIGESSTAVVKGDTATVEFNFTSVDNSGEDTGDATGVWYVGNTKVATSTVYQGKNSFDITQYLHNGDNKIKLQVTDSVGSMGSKTWNINIVEFYLESIFDDSLVYSGEVTFRFTPYGNINKDVSFTLDGKKLGSVTTAVTGRQMTYAIPAQRHGAHLLEVTMTANINGKAVTSNTIYKDIMWAEEGNNTPIISCATKEFAAKQYSTTGIIYTVYNPASSTANITLEVDGIKTSTLTVGRTAQTWSFKSSDIGTHTLTI